MNLVENWASVLRPDWSSQKVEPGPALGTGCSGMEGPHFFFFYLMLVSDGRPVPRPEVLSNIRREELGRVVAEQLPGEDLGRISKLG